MTRGFYHHLQAIATSICNWVMSFVVRVMRLGTKKALIWARLESITQSKGPSRTA